MEQAKTGSPIQKWVVLLPLDVRLHAKLVALLLLLNREADARKYHKQVKEGFDDSEKAAVLDDSLLFANPASYM